NMIKPYTIRFVSPRADMGKTFIASNVVSLLKNKGYVVGVIKHCPHGIDLEDKDSHVYILKGADVVIASSSNLGVIYRRAWIDSLSFILGYINAPIIIVEGFKGDNVGDTIVVAENIDEARKTSFEQYVVAYVVKNVSEDVKNLKIPVFTFNEVEELAKFIEDRAINYIYSQLPQTNCRYCGFNSCKELANAYVKGLAYGCAVKTDIRLIVDGRGIELNPFVKRLLRSMIVGFIDVLKGIPKERKEIIIELKE
ncbi:MAG: molybdopterin-guanine dinucleotide biosynthesis protein MobB, partial [Ignisphaera sp.]